MEESHSKSRPLGFQSDAVCSVMMLAELPQQKRVITYYVNVLYSI